MKERAFEGYPVGPYHSCCSEAVSILKSAHDTAAYLADIFEYVGMQVDPTPEGQQIAVHDEDLLRAMLTFASSGLDAMIKQLIRDALPDVINLHDGAQERFRQFVEKRLQRGREPDYSFVAGVIADADPRRRLVGDLVKRLTSRSLQSVDEVLRVGSCFDIPSDALIPEPYSTRRIFSARNQIVHEMDIDFAQPNRNRRSREYSDMEAHTQELFGVAIRFLTEVDARLEHDIGPPD